MATFSAMAKSGDQHLRKDGTRRVYIRFSHKGVARYIPTQIYVSEKKLTSDMKIKDVRAKNACDEIIVEYRRRIAKLHLELNDYPIDKIVEVAVEKEVHSYELSFTEYYETKWRVAHQSLRGIKNYDCAVNALRRFYGREIILVNDLSAKTMQAFAESLSDKKRAASLYCSSIVKIFNDMRSEYNDEETGKVLIKHSLAKFVAPHQVEAEQRGLSVEQIRRIFALPHVGIKHSWAEFSRYDLALDCFKLSFCLMGMNAVDMYYLEDYDGEKITYERAKTHLRRRDRAKMVVVVHSIIRELLSRYSGIKRVFRFSDVYSSPSSFNHALNLGIKEVGEAAGIPNLQFYAARHSFASIAYNDVGIPMSVVDEMLCHKGTDMRMTKLYIKKDFTHINEANFKVIAFVFGENA